MSTAGSTTIKGPLFANGGLSVTSSGNNVFNVEPESGNTTIYGTLNANSNVTIDSNLQVNGEFSIASDVFSIDKSGNTIINGTLTVNQDATFIDLFTIKSSQTGDKIIYLNALEDGISYFLGGNIGIGINPPLYKLDVVGNINVSDGSTYKIGGTDVVFSQWVNYNGGRDISFSGNSGEGTVYINIADSDINQENDSNSMVIGGNLTITNSGTGNSGTLILGTNTIDSLLDEKLNKDNVVWLNNPEGATVENNNITSIYTSYVVQTAKNMGIETSPYTDSSGTTLKPYTLSVGGDVNIESPGNLYFAGEKLEVNVWTYNTDNPAGVTGAKYIYFATPSDTDTISYSYVGIGTTTPKYNLEVYGNINLTGVLSLNGKGVIFPDPDSEDNVVIADWQTINSTLSDGTTYTNLYYPPSTIPGGYIGIGTQEPEQVLHLQGDANSGNILSIRGLNDLSYLSIYTSKTLETGLLGFTNTPTQLELKNINSGGTILISNASNTGNIFIDSGSYVGIGTTSPQTNLHVSGTNGGNVQIDGTLLLSGNGNTTISLKDSKYTNDTNDRIAFTQASNDSLTINPNNDYTEGLSMMGFVYLNNVSSTDNYNFGISVQTPKYKLDVNGDINFTGTLYKNTIEQYSSQWFPTTSGAANYIIYPPSQNSGSTYQVGINTGYLNTSLPQATLDVRDTTVHGADVYNSQFMLYSSVDITNGNYLNRGSTIELDYTDVSTNDFIKGIRMHAVSNDFNGSGSSTNQNEIGFAIDTNSNSASYDFINTLHLDYSGNLGIGNFIAYTGSGDASKDVRGKIHIINPSNNEGTYIPSLIIANGTSSGNPSQSTSDLNVISSSSTKTDNLGINSQIFGINIKSTVDATNNYVSQNAASSNGASAFYLSANGGLTNATSNYKTAFGVITTNSSGSSDGEQLQEVFSVSKIGNIMIRTNLNESSNNDNYTDPTVNENLSGQFGIDIGHWSGDTSSQKYSGSINVTGGYFVNGAPLPTPWKYVSLGTSGSTNTSNIYNYDTGFSEGNTTYGIKPDTSNAPGTAWSVTHDILEQNSNVGIGLSQPRGALDVAGPIYSRYGVIGCNELSDQGNFSLYHTTSYNYDFLYGTNGEINDGFINYAMSINTDGSVHINCANKNKIIFESSGNPFVTFDYTNNVCTFDTNLTVNGNETITGTLTVSNSASIEGNLTVGYNTTTLNGLLQVNNNIEATGYISASGNIVSSGNVYANSDVRLKTNILPIDNSLEKINKLQGVYFNKKNKTNREVGLIAQDVEKIIPEIVTEDNSEEKIKSICYSNLTAVLIEAVKELTEKNNELLKRIEKLEN